MKYIVVRRASNYVYDVNPKVDGVQKEMLPYYNEFWRGKEAESVLREAYTVELNSLEDLHQFIKECNNDVMIFNPASDGSGFRLHEIAIYDSNVIDNEDAIDDDEDFEIVEWPDIQELMGYDDFKENTTLIEPNDNMGIGSSTYLVSKEWLESLDKN